MTDDECIAIAMLHGPGFTADGGEGFGPPCRWYVTGNDIHPMEQQNEKETSWLGFESLADITRAYCEHYELLED